MAGPGSAMVRGFVGNNLALHRSMFNIFKKKARELIGHRYKNLMIDLPSNWLYEIEEGDIEACFEPRSESTLRLHIIQLTAPVGSDPAQVIKDLTNGLPYDTTTLNYILAGPDYKEFSEREDDLSCFTWRLIQYHGPEKTVNLVIVTYTFLQQELYSPIERKAIELIENSLQTAKILD